jgi:hypothetical protein
MPPSLGRGCHCSPARSGATTALGQRLAAEGVDDDVSVWLLQQALCHGDPVPVDGKARALRAEGGEEHGARAAVPE